MKKVILKNALILLLALSGAGVSNAQSQSRWLSISYDRSNRTVESDEELDNNQLSSLEERMEIAENATSEMLSMASTGTHLRIRTTDAPPDCPECNPDPGGGVVDVPFDKRLLFVLFAASIFVIKKSYK